MENQGKQFRLKARSLDNKVYHFGGYFTRAQADAQVEKMFGQGGWMMIEVEEVDAPEPPARLVQKMYEEANVAMELAEEGGFGVDDAEIEDGVFFYLDAAVEVEGEWHHYRDSPDEWEYISSNVIVYDLRLTNEDGDDIYTITEQFRTDFEEGLNIGAEQMCKEQEGY